MTRDYAAPDWRGLCEELVIAMNEHPAGLHGASYASSWTTALTRARAALAQPEPEVVGPSDEELLELYPVTMVDHQDAFTFARAVLARYAHQPAPPAEGEVAELVDRLRRASDGASAMGWEQDSWTIARAAELLEQSQAAPVPVAERLPGPEDCDAEGRCWWLAPETAQKCAVWCFGPKYPPSMFGATHWLPATALPLPQGEVE